MTFSDGVFQLNFRKGKKQALFWSGKRPVEDRAEGVNSWTTKARRTVVVFFAGNVNLNLKTSREPGKTQKGSMDGEKAKGKVSSPNCQSASNYFPFLDSSEGFPRNSNPFPLNRKLHKIKLGKKNKCHNGVYEFLQKYPKIKLLRTAPLASPRNGGSLCLQDYSPVISTSLPRLN